MVLERELAVAGLLALVWAFEKVAERGLRTSPVLGQLVAGILVGPPLANLVPNVDALRLLGKVGTTTSSGNNSSSTHHRHRHRRQPALSSKLLMWGPQRDPSHLSNRWSLLLPLLPGWRDGPCVRRRHVR